MISIRLLRLAYPSDSVLQRGGMKSKLRSRLPAEIENGGEAGCSMIGPAIYSYSHLFVRQNTPICPSWRPNDTIEVFLLTDSEMSSALSRSPSCAL